MNLAKQEASTIDARVELLTSHVFALRVAGLSYRKIAERAGCSVSRAYEIVVDRLRELRTLNEELTGELRALELSRLDDMWRRLYPEHHDEPLEPKRALALIRIVQQRRAIAGLDVVQRNALPPADVPYAGSFDLDNPALTLDDLRDLERVTMRAMGLDPSLEVQASVRPAELFSELTAVSSQENEIESAEQNGEEIASDPDTGYPIAVAFTTSRAPATYQPE